MAGNHRIFVVADRKAMLEDMGGSHRMIDRRNFTIGATLTVVARPLQLLSCPTANRGS